MTSLSTRFLGQPKLTKPTRGGAASPDGLDGLTGCLPGTFSATSPAVCGSASAWLIYSF